MPKEINHIFFADQSLAELKKTGESLFFSLLEKELSFFHFGSIATDTFYYSLKIPFFEKNYFQWGDLVHGAEGNDTSISLINALTYLKNNKNDPDFTKKLAFIAGFFTHFTMDVNFHPFVYYFSGNYYDEEPSERVNAAMRHRIIEGWMDLHILNNNKVLLHEFEAINHIHANKEDNFKMLEFIAKFYSETWETKVDIFKFLKKGYFIQMLLNKVFFKNKTLFDLARTLNDIFDDKLRGHLALFYPKDFEKMPNYIVNFDKFQHPVTGEEFNGSLDDIWNNSLKLSLSFLTAIEKYVFTNSSLEELKKVIKGYSLDVGLEGVKVHDVKYFSPWKLVP